MSSKTHFRLDIEGLRAVAILLVVLYHARLPGFSGGYVGVDVFFVLSGFLITDLLVKEIDTSGKLNLARFYTRRIKRLLPAAALVLSATIIAGYFLYSPLEQEKLPKSAFATAGYISNLYFAREATDYLGDHTETNPFLHTWSLSVEEQFYLAWPLIVLLSLKFGRRGFLTVMFLLCAATLALSVYLTHKRQPWAFFSSPTRAWEFALGGLCAVLPIPANRTFRWIGFFLIILSAVLFSRQTPYPGTAALLPVLGTVAVLHLEGGKLGETLSLSWLQWIGRLSYSWYLWHWPVLVYASSLWKLNLSGRITCLLISLALSQITYTLIENPVRRSLLKPKYALTMATCLTLFGISAALVWRNLSTKALNSKAQISFAKAKSDRPALYNCVADLFTSDLKECVLGEGKTVVLFGDSHAAQWFPGLNGYRVVTLLKGSCPPANVRYSNSTVGRRFTECEEWREKAILRINELRPQVVVMSSSQGYVSGGLVSSADWEKGTYDTLSRINSKVVLLRDPPFPGFDVPLCLSRSAWRTGSPCDFEQGGEMAHKAELSAVRNFDQTSYVDLTEHICPNPVCAPEVNGHIVYSDSNHLTASFVSSLGPALRDAIESASRTFKSR